MEIDCISQNGGKHTHLHTHIQRDQRERHVLFIYLFFSPMIGGFDVLWLLQQLIVFRCCCSHSFKPLLSSLLSRISMLCISLLVGVPSARMCFDLIRS